MTHPEVIEFACRFLDPQPSMKGNIAALLDAESKSGLHFSGRVFTSESKEWLNGEGFGAPGTIIRRLAAQAGHPVLALTVRLNRAALRRALRNQDADDVLPDNVGTTIWTVTYPDGRVEDVTEQWSRGPVEWHMHGDLEETVSEMVAVCLGPDEWDSHESISGTLKPEFDAPDALIPLCEAVASAGAFTLKRFGATRMLVVQGPAGKRMQAVTLEEIERITKATGIMPS